MSPFWNCHIMLYMKITPYTNLIFDPEELWCILVNFKPFYLDQNFLGGPEEGQIFC